MVLVTFYKSKVVPRPQNFCIPQKRFSLALFMTYICSRTMTAAEGWRASGQPVWVVCPLPTQGTWVGSCNNSLPGSDGLKNS